MMAKGLKALAREILVDPHRRVWTLQGFGMLRCNLPGDIRLNVWDKSYEYRPKPSLIHDHPWDFTSIIVAGKLTNWLYDVGPETWCSGNPYWERQLRPGIGTEQLREEDTKVVLRYRSASVYGEGDSYKQFWNEVHQSDCETGTVTLNFRDRSGRPDVARVYYELGGKWQTAEPRIATRDEIEDICDRSLSLWF